MRESAIYNDPSTGSYSEHVLREGVGFTSRIPTVVTANTAFRLGGAQLAADIITGVNNTQGHVGAELWAGNVPLRAGASIDASKLIQGSCGAGLRFGHFGLDIALASHSRNVTRERALELGAGLSLYR